MDVKFQCPLCLDRFKDPRILTCFHSFCRNCLERYLKSYLRPLNAFECPVCRARHTLPSGGVDSIQKNFYLEESAAQGVKRSHPMCVDHPEEDLRFYCRDCKVSICRDCKVVSHEGHAADMVDKVVATVTQKSESILNVLRENIFENERKLRGSVEPDIKDLQASLSILKDTTERMKNEIDKLLQVTTESVNYQFDRKKDTLNLFQAQAGIKLGKLAKYRQSLLQANQLKKPDVVFKLFGELTDKNEIKRMIEFRSLSDRISSNNHKFDVKRWESAFQRLSRTVLQTFAEFKEELCEELHGHKDDGSEEPNRIGQIVQQTRGGPLSGTLDTESKQLQLNYQIPGTSDGNSNNSLIKNQNTETKDESKESSIDFPVIDGARVKLTSGGTFEEGLIYTVRNKKGQEHKMLWTGGELVMLTSDITAGKTSQRITAVETRGNSELQGNATGVPMSQHVDRHSPVASSTIGHTFITPTSCSTMKAPCQVVQLRHPVQVQTIQVIPSSSSVSLAGPSNGESQLTFSNAITKCNTQVAGIVTAIVSHKRKHSEVLDRENEEKPQDQRPSTSERDNQ